tara:strand:+ start:254 stop:475 length:222 start_codon:yes stop_codon:yes gene_type:complete
VLVVLRERLCGSLALSHGWRRCILHDNVVLVVATDDNTAWHLRDGRVLLAYTPRIAILVFVSGRTPVRAVLAP